MYSSSFASLRHIKAHNSNSGNNNDNENRKRHRKTSLTEKTTSLDRTNEARFIEIRREKIRFLIPCSLLVENNESEKN